MILTIEVVAILAMATFMFVAIWGFILLNQIYNQLKYKNYLMEKLVHNIGSHKESIDELTKLHK